MKDNFAELTTHTYVSADNKILGVHLALIGEAPAQLATLLARALNTLPPHDPQWKDWFELADALDSKLPHSTTAG